MVVVGYHVSHEQFPPSRLLELALAAQEAGFDGLLSSDHLAPFSRAQGESGFAWSWLGAALAATDLPAGVVTAPVQRYHPVIVAQACATLAEMFPGRFWVAVGSGENLNEHVTGDRWPPDDLRDHRLQEAVEVIRALWAGETVTREGLLRVEGAKLYTRPATAPPMYAAAMSPSTAEWAGDWADGLITVNGPELVETVEAFRRGGGEGKPVLLKAALAWAPDEDDALAQAFEQWRTNVLPGPLLSGLETPEQMEMAATFVRPEDVAKAIVVSSDPAVHLDRIREWLAAGVDEIYLHNVTREQDAFLDVFAREVLPALREAEPRARLGGPAR